MNHKDAYDLRGLFWPDWLKEHWHKAGGSLNGLTEPTVSQVLYSLVIANKPSDDLYHLPYTIVETGVYYGATACWLALAAKEADAQYYGFDVLNDSVTMVNKLFEDHDLTSNARVLRGSAPQAVIDLFAQDGEGCSIDLLFIDDDHSGAHVEDEYRTLWPLIRPGGIMAFHDVIGGFPIWEVIKSFTDDIVKLVSQPFNQTGQAPFGGLGILRKPVD